MLVDSLCLSFVVEEQLAGKAEVGELRVDLSNLVVGKTERLSLDERPENLQLLH